MTRHAHISKLKDKWQCDLIGDTCEVICGCYGTSEQVDEFIAVQTEDTRVVCDGRVDGASAEGGDK